jgi:plastocyanin
MRFALVTFLCAGLLAALGPSAAVAGMKPDAGANVSIFAASFGAARVDVLAGDTVTWRNDSVRAHTVSATDGSWASQRLGASSVFTHQFSAAGVATYYCQVHPFMRAEVDIHNLLLDAPDQAAAPGQPLELIGRAALAEGSAVTITAADGTPAATATVDSAGAFHATVKPRTTTSYHAVSGAEVSPDVQVLVLDRHVKASARAHHGRVTVRTRVAPAARGATVVLQLHLKERFGWWPVRRARLDAKSTARFSVRLKHGVRARVVLTAADGVTPLVRSPVLHLKPH